MGKVTNWVVLRLFLYLTVSAVFYVIGTTMGWIPKPLQNIVSWFGSNFLLISVLIMFLFTWLIIRALTSKRRIEHI